MFLFFLLLDRDVSSSLSPPPPSPPPPPPPPPLLQRQNYIDVATGSLGQGLSVAAGMAYCGKYIDKARSASYHHPSLITPCGLFLH